MKLTRTALLLCLALVLPSAWAREITLTIGKKTVHAEIAATPQSRERGLMQRDHLCADCGMLFVFEKADRYSFWMKDTPLPLSIAFITVGGTIINIEEMQANTTDIHSAEGDVLYALEMPGGWFASSSIKPGDQMQGLKRVSKGHWRSDSLNGITNQRD